MTVRVPYVVLALGTIVVGLMVHLGRDAPLVALTGAEGLLHHDDGGTA